MADQPTPDWIETLRARGWSQPVSSALDVLEPFGPLGAQVLYAAAPLLGWMIPRHVLDGLAQALETPGGVERLRAHLEHNPRP